MDFQHKFYDLVYFLHNKSKNTKEYVIPINVITVGR